MYTDNKKQTGYETRQLVREQILQRRMKEQKRQEREIAMQATNTDGQRGLISEVQ